LLLILYETDTRELNDIVGTLNANCHLATIFQKHNNTKWLDEGEVNTSLAMVSSMENAIH
jgi:hypothetical protein